MNASPLKGTIISAMAAVLLLISGSASAGEKLKVFILAGQSNMVGHARAHTIATLYHSVGIDINDTTIEDLNGRPRYLIDHDQYQPIRELI